ncbi:ribonuclease HI [Myxacorys almedinensis]|uniref:Ribonuclease H n=1 Tax=Myxacorys almedinensis A TaxID=2690445 RepID=A0A8J8CLR4_9CYAN|nr:ribonuclease HI [Myxacorys almedinensis]NDJ18020.1 ribonuclease HI [Myxacorys almedinensis A]
MNSFNRIQSIYTDGACSGNPGPGGWGTVIYFEGGAVQELGGSERDTTNNRMEMQAAIAGLSYLADSGQRDPIILYTDSEYVKNGITKWIGGWKKKGWKTSTGKPVLNQELWEILDQFNSSQVEWRYVRGHSGDVGNERCDAIARAFSLGKIPELKTLDSHQQGANLDMIDAQSLSVATSDESKPNDSLDNVPREIRVANLRNSVDMLHMADEIAAKGYLITSSELADLMDINASAVTSRGDNWVWRNWVVSRVRREGNQILWQLERVD